MSSKILIVSLSIVALGSAACQSKKASMGSAALSSGTCKVAKPNRLATPSAFALDKVQDVAGEAPASAWIALADVECAAHSAGVIHEIAASGAKAGLRQQTFLLPVDVDLGALRADPCVLGLSREEAFHNLSLEGLDASSDPLAAEQEHLARIGLTSLLAKMAEIFSAAPPVIAVVDTGVRYTHEDLKDSMWKNAAGEYGYDFAQNDTDPNDGHYHGTHVAGLAAAAAGNAVGIMGVAPGAKIMAVRVLDSNGSTTTDKIANGILYAAENGADVINLSLGGRVTSHSPILREAIRQAIELGAVVVAAAGNDGKEISPSYMISPAGLAPEFEGLISVGSIDTQDGARSLFSNYGSAYVEIVAPGAVKSGTTSATTTGLLSTVPNAAKPYNRLAGTSMASPVVAGGAALVIAALRQAGDSPTPAQVEAQLRALAKSGSSLDVSGVVDLLAAAPVCPSRP